MLDFREWREFLKKEFGEIVRHPRLIGDRIDEKSPWLHRRFLGAASNIAEPFLLGMGMSVDSLDEESVRVAMPGYWRNQGENSIIHTGALSSLGEFTTKIFWEHHLDLRSAEISSRRVEIRVLSRPSGNMRAIFRLSVAEREETLHRLRAGGKVESQSIVNIYDASDRLVAEVDVTLQFSRHLSLRPGAGET